MARTVNSPRNTDGPKPSATAGTQNSEPGMGPSMNEIRNRNISGTMMPKLRGRVEHPTRGSGEDNPAPTGTIPG